MDNKFNAPDSDQSVRHNHPDSGDENVIDADMIPDLQTSNKSGKHSTAEKLAASRPEFGAGRGAQPVPGAFGDTPPQPLTSQLRCSGCGRYFDTRSDLSAHEPECLTAKAATAGGRDSLRQQDSTPYQPNDAESKEHRFQHGTRQPE